MLRRPRASRAACLRLCALVGMLGPAPRVCGQARNPGYEARRLQLFLDAAHLVRDPAPEGKCVAYVRIERRQVFEPDDLLVPIILPRGASTWPNAFHWLTRQRTVQREVLLHAGGIYRQALADESMRNLRDLDIFALVQVVAVRASRAGCVGVVVFTRDLWSLRLEQQFSGVGSTFTLGGQLVERNLWGLGKELAVRAQLDPLRYSAGETYFDPRVLQGELRASESLDVIFNRDSGDLEGGLGSLRLQRPFYTLAQRTAFDVYARYLDYVYRDVRDGRVVGLSADPAPGRYGTLCELWEPNCLPRVFRDRGLQLSAAVAYRAGQRYKQTFWLGAALATRHVSPTAETGLAAEARTQFARLVLPRVRQDVYPFVRYLLDVPRFVVFTNLASFGRAESVQVGPRIDARVGVPLRVYGASSDGLVLHGLIGYVLARGGGLAELSVEGLARLESGNVVDERGVLQLRAASPAYRWSFGRLVLRLNWDVRKNDTQGSLVSLGGDAGLRGYPAQAFALYGARRLIWNVEYRSLPLMLQSVHIGLVAFYDAGSVYARLSRMRVHQAVGTGLRVLFPQFNPYAFRLDFGVPLDRAGFAVSVAYGSDQFIPLTAQEDLIAQSSRDALP